MSDHGSASNGNGSPNGGAVDGDGVTSAWVRIDPGGLEEGRVTTVVAAGRAICLTRTAAGYGALDNHCPHQGGPLGDGQIADGYVICPWHAYEYDPATGKPPPGFKDGAVPYPVEDRGDDGLWVELPVAEDRVSLMDQMVDVLCEWGLDTVFGMVGHSNLGLADALRKAEEDGRITYVGIRHEGAGAFAASGLRQGVGPPGRLPHHRRSGRHQPAHRPVGRQGRPGADRGPHRPGEVAGHRAGDVPGGRPRRRRSSRWPSGARRSCVPRTPPSWPPWP